MSYSTTSGTSGLSERITCDERGVALVKKFKYLKRTKSFKYSNWFVPQSKSEINGLLHVNNDRLFLLVDIGALRQIDLRIANVTLCREGDTRFGDGDLDRFANVGQILANACKLDRGHFDGAAEHVSTFYWSS